MKKTYYLLSTISLIAGLFYGCSQIDFDEPMVTNQGDILETGIANTRFNDY